MNLIFVGGIWSEPVRGINFVFKCKQGLVVANIFIVSLVDASVVTLSCIFIKKLIQMELISVVFLLIGFSVRGVHATVPLTSPCDRGGEDYRMVRFRWVLV